MDKIFSAFDFNWRSNDIDLSDLPINKNTTKVDINIVKESHEFWPPLNKSKSDTSFLQMGENDLRLEVSDVGRFRALNGNEIAWHKFNSQVDDKDIRTFLMGSVIGAILIQRDLILMHGNALEKDGKTIVCLGHSGAGKSTLAYALIKNGWNFLSDDLVAITNEGYILRGIPRLKLWEDSLNSFGINKENLVSVRNNLNKYIYKPEARCLAKKDTKLSAFYLVNRFSRENNFFQKENIVKINDEKTKLIYLRNNLYRPRFVRGLRKEGHLFLKLSHLQKTIPISFLNLPCDVESLIGWLEKINL